jgi:hypothetical protein
MMRSAICILLLTEIMETWAIFSYHLWFCKAKELERAVAGRRKWGCIVLPHDNALGVDSTGELSSNETGFAIVMMSTNKPY